MGSKGTTQLSKRVRAALGALRSAPAPTTAPQHTGNIVGMLGDMGATLLASAQATSDVENTLKQLARRYSRPELRIFVLPTVVFIEDPHIPGSPTEMFPAQSDTLRLDQSDAVDKLVHRALRDAPNPSDVTAAIASAGAAPSRFGNVMTVVGHTMLTIGFGLVLNPTAASLPVYVALGVIVGTIVQLGTRVRTLSLILPVFTAFAVTLVVSIFVMPHVHDDVIRLVAPSLVSFLPGMTLTVAALELTSGQVMAGASRLVFGVARLGLLAFGVYAALSIVHVPAATGHAPAALGGWAPWVGILLVSFGYYLFSSAPRGSLPWLFFALLVAYAAQMLGNLMLGAVLSGLVGALVVIPLVGLAGRLKVAPSRAVMLTCAYWLLVPGAMGFIGLSEAASGSSAAVNTILQTAGSLISISIGMVLGAGLSRDTMMLVRGWKEPTAISKQVAHA